jgi:hypothetical protein
MIQECFICSTTINGDEHFFQHHLNQCLDSSSASTSSIAAYNNAASSSSSSSRSTSLSQHDQGTSGRFNSNSNNDDQLSTDAALALSLSITSTEDAEESARSIALALQLTQSAQGDQTQFRSRPIVGCPICARSWEDLECPSSEREVHADECMRRNGTGEEADLEGGGGDWQEGGKEWSQKSANHALLLGSGLPKAQVRGTPGTSYFDFENIPPSILRSWEDLTDLDRRDD